MPVKSQPPKRRRVAPPPGFTRMNLNLETELHSRFKAAVALEQTNMTDVLIEFIRRYVEEHEPRASKKTKS